VDAPLPPGRGLTADSTALAGRGANQLAARSTLAP
jgi:hypothetical protein